MVRLFPVWEEGRRVLRDNGIDPERFIFYSIAPATYAAIALVGEEPACQSDLLGARFFERLCLVAGQVPVGRFSGQGEELGERYLGKA